MTKVSDEGDLPRYAALVLEIVDRIPCGKVLGYGDVAELIGEGGPRQVGQVMARYGHLVDWHRVIYNNGRMPMGHEHEGKRRLEADGVGFRAPTSSGFVRVDMKNYRWDGTSKL